MPEPGRVQELEGVGAAGLDRLLGQVRLRRVRRARRLGFVLGCGCGLASRGMLTLHLQGSGGRDGLGTAIRLADGAGAGLGGREGSEAQWLSKGDACPKTSAKEGALLTFREMRGLLSARPFKPRSASNKFHLLGGPGPRLPRVRPRINATPSAASSRASLTRAWGDAAQFHPIMTS